MNTPQVPESCATCPVHRIASLNKLGIDVGAYDFVVGLAGNPNTGKSTVFNALTGLRQHTGNWPGKTVRRAEGGFSYEGKRYKLVDLPGTYSLLSTSDDEDIARNFLLFARPEVTVVVADASRLERNLNLVLQILEITDRVVLCLNLIDEARRRGLVVDDRSLARELGVPVVPTAARQGEGIPALLAAVDEVATGKTQCRPYRLKSEPPELKRAIEELTAALRESYPGVPNTRWVALRLLEGDPRIVQAVESGELAALASPAPEQPSHSLPPIIQEATS